jgi:ABC-type sugar transport system permease subunit
MEMFFWLAVFTALLLGLGFVIGGPLAVLLFVHFEKKNNWLNAFFAAGGTFAVLFGIFIWLLELTLFQGFIIEALF